MTRLIFAGWVLWAVVAADSSYKMDFDNETKPMDQVLKTKGIKLVCDLKSFLYLVNTELDFSDGFKWQRVLFNNPECKPAAAVGGKVCYV